MTYTILLPSPTNALEILGEIIDELIVMPTMTILVNNGLRYF
jgi:hypothetical protein